MSKKITGIKSAYKDALDHEGENIAISANLVVEMVHRIEDLECAVIDMRASLRTCFNTSQGALDQFKDI